MSGCDFLTPNNHKKKPKCKFCECEKVHWPHVLFECEEVEGATFFKKYVSSLDCPGTQNVRLDRLKQILQKLWNEKKFEDLFKIMMGSCLEQYGLNYSEIVHVIVAATADKLSHVDREWCSIASD